MGSAARGAHGQPAAAFGGAFGSRPLSPSEERELKELHRKLIRRLHPDIHPDLPEDAQRFFLIAQAAYENGDVDTLRVVDTATEDYEEHADTAGLSEDDVADRACHGRSTAQRST